MKTNQHLPDRLSATMQVAFQESAHKLPFLHAKDLPLFVPGPGYPSVAPSIFGSEKEVPVESMRKNTVHLKTELFPVISLFLKWYLCRETLARNKKIKKLLDEMEAGKVSDPQHWASLFLLRMQILGEAFPVLSGLLERRLNPSEVVHLFERIEEFVQLYAMGLKT